MPSVPRFLTECPAHAGPLPSPAVAPAALADATLALRVAPATAHVLAVAAMSAVALQVGPLVPETAEGLAMGVGAMLVGMAAAYGGTRALVLATVRRRPAGGDAAPRAL